MFLILVLLVVVVAVAGAGLLGVGLFSDDRRKDRTGLLAALSAPVVLVVGVVLLAALVLGVGGLQGGGDHEPEPSSEAPGPPTTRVDAEPAATLPSARLQNVTTDFPVVTVQVAEDDRFSAYQAVGGLAPGGAVRVKAGGFGWHDRGLVEQCVTELGHQTACGPSLTVQFDEDGQADFLFVLRGDIAPGGCRIGQPTCLLRVRVGDQEATTQTVLVDQLVPGQVTVTPSRRLAEGESVEVSVTGFPAASMATAVLCAPSATYDARRCSPALSTFPVDARGSGRTTVAITPGRVGTDRVLCGPRNQCGLMVLAGPGYVAAGAAIVSFSDGPGVAYAADRVLTGIVIAVVLFGLAVVVALRTDWTKPTEAATPEMDRADLRADESLDDLFGTDQELDERDPIPW